MLLKEFNANWTSGLGIAAFCYALSQFSAWSVFLSIIAALLGLWSGSIGKRVQSAPNSQKSFFRVVSVTGTVIAVFLMIISGLSCSQESISNEVGKRVATYSAGVIRELGDDFPEKKLSFSTDHAQADDKLGFIAIKSRSNTVAYGLVFATTKIVEDAADTLNDNLGVITIILIALGFITVLSTAIANAVWTSTEMTGQPRTK